MIANVRAQKIEEREKKREKSRSAKRARKIKERGSANLFTNFFLLKTFVFTTSQILQMNSNPRIKPGLVLFLSPRKNSFTLHAKARNLRPKKEREELRKRAGKRKRQA
jgi:hypothetical protein